MSVFADTVCITLSQVPGFLYHISPALVTVSLGGFVLQKFFVSRANKALLIDSLNKDLDQLRNDAIDYWNLDCKAGGAEVREKAAILEQKIKGGIKGVTSELGQYAERYREKVNFINLMAEVSDACTGGDFESAKKGRDRQRYLMVVNTIGRVKSELRRGKL